MNVLEMDVLKLSNIKLMNAAEVLYGISTEKKQLDISNITRTLLTPEMPNKIYEEMTLKIYNGLTAIFYLNAYIIFIGRKKGERPILSIEEKVDINKFMEQNYVKYSINYAKKFLNMMLTARENEKMLLGMIGRTETDVGHEKVIRKTQDMINKFDNFDKYYREYFEALDNLKYLNKYLKYKSKYMQLKAEKN